VGENGYGYEEENMREELKLSEFQKDALQELGNIGACHATTSLAEMTGITIYTHVPKVEIIPVRDIMCRVDAYLIVAGVLLELRGDISAYLYVIFTERSAQFIIELLLGRTFGDTDDIEGDMGSSALKEVGNILASSFCDAISEFLGISVIPSPPVFACDMTGAILQRALIDIAGSADHVLMFRCDFKCEEEKSNDNNDKIYGYILLFPREESLKTLLSMLDEKVKEYD